MRIIHGTVLFLAGVALASAFFISAGHVTQAQAGPNCPSTPLPVVGYLGENTISSQNFTLIYSAPKCISAYGFTVQNAEKYDEDKVKITYSQ